MARHTDQSFELKHWWYILNSLPKIEGSGTVFRESGDIERWMKMRPKT